MGNCMNFVVVVVVLVVVVIVVVVVVVVVEVVVVITIKRLKDWQKHETEFIKRAVILS